MNKVQMQCFESKKNGFPLWTEYQMAKMYFVDVHWPNSRIYDSLPNPKTYSKTSKIISPFFCLLWEQEALASWSKLLEKEQVVWDFLFYY